MKCDQYNIQVQDLRIFFWFSLYGTTLSLTHILLEHLEIRQKIIITDSRSCTSRYADLLVESPCLDMLHRIGNVVNCSS
jgi:hypothetical protein